MLLEKARRVNIESTTTAKLCELVELFGSKGQADLDHTRFLPYKLPEEPGPGPKISVAAANTIRQLQRDGRLPSRVSMLLLDDLKHAGVGMKGPD